jgi:hypothetical protein
MKPQEAALDPASRSIVARLRVISWVIWIMSTVGGAVVGAAYVITEFDALNNEYISGWYKGALIVTVIACGVVGCFLGYLAKVVIDWARRVLVLLDQIAHR